MISIGEMILNERRKQEEQEVFVKVMKKGSALRHILTFLHTPVVHMYTDSLTGIWDLQFNDSTKWRIDAMIYILIRILNVFKLETKGQCERTGKQVETGSMLSKVEEL